MFKSAEKHQNFIESLIRVRSIYIYFDFYNKICRGKHKLILQIQTLRVGFAKRNNCRGIPSFLGAHWPAQKEKENLNKDRRRFDCLLLYPSHLNIKLLSSQIQNEHS